MVNWTDKDSQFLYDLCEQIRDEKPFAFSRFGDGEWITIAQNRTEDANCDGNTFYADLGQRLKEIVSEKQDYYMGHQNVSAYSLKSDYPQDWVNSDILHELSETQGLEYMFDLFESVHVVMIGNESLQNLPFVNESIEIPYKNVWLEYEEVLQKIKNKIDDKKHKVFLFAAGMCSEVFIDDLWKYNNKNTYMDIGSTFDPYVGRNSRTYHDRLNNVSKIYKKPKIGYAFAYHHSDDIRPLGKQVTEKSVNSFFNNCKYDFKTIVVDNQSEPKTSFSEIVDLNTENLHYTYIENQYEKGITGAWDLAAKQSIEQGCDIVILTGDDIVFDDTINNLIDYIHKDKDSDNSIYGALASGISNKIQLSEKPNGKIEKILGSKFQQHLGGHLYAFTKEFYHKYKQSNGDLFIIDQKHNGGDGKWGGNEGNVMCWAEQGAKCIVVGTCCVHHQIETRRSWTKPRDKDRQISV